MLGGVSRNALPKPEGRADASVLYISALGGWEPNHSFGSGWVVGSFNSERYTENLPCQLDLKPKPPQKRSLPARVVFD